jgi:DNA-binding MarR family transcriptional regulator
VLTLTEAGRQLIDSVMRRRRAAIGDVLAEMPAGRRAALADGLNAFSAVADGRFGGHDPSAAWAP